MVESRLGHRVLGNAVFALLDNVLVKLSTTIAFVILVRLLSDADVAAIGIASGYLILLMYLDVSPIRVLLRDYPSLGDDPEKRDRLLTALFSFWFVEALLILALAGVVAWFVLTEVGIPGLPFLFVAMAVDLVALILQDWLKLVFYAAFKQAVVTKLGFRIGLVRLASYAILLLWPSLPTYGWLLVGTAVVSSVVWIALFLRHFGYRPRFSSDTPALIRHSVGSYGLWDHLNRTVVDTLFGADTMILSWVVLTGGVREIGNYTIALRFTSLMFLVPRQIQHGIQLALANQSEDEERRETAFSFAKISAAVSVAQLVGVVLLGRLLLGALFGPTDPEVFRYTVILAVAISIMNLTYPLLGVINNFCNLRAVFFQVFLPVFVAGFGTYWAAAHLRGATGIAYANIVVYTVLALGIGAFLARHYPLRPRWELISEREKVFLSGLIRGGR